MTRGLVAAAAIVTLAAVLAWTRTLGSHAPPDGVPTAVVTRGDFVESLSLRGEVQALRSAVVTAPRGAGDLTLVTLAPNGSRASKGDIVLRFDSAGQLRLLDERRSALKQAVAEIERARAAARSVDETNLTTETTARYTVERARLDVRAGELLSAVDAEIARLALADAEQALSEAIAMREAGRAAAAAEISGLEQKREKALADLRETERNIEALTVRAPVDGLVVVLPNRRAGGPGQRRPFRAGDQVWPGATIVELPDLSTLRVVARLDEVDRGRLARDQRATVLIDALPGAELPARVAAVSTLTEVDFSSWPPERSFTVSLDLDRGDDRLRPSMSATARLELQRTPNASIVPAEAVHQLNGRSVAHVWTGRAFEARPIEIGGRNVREVTVRAGLVPGERVALTDPLRAGGPGEGGER